MRCRLSARTEQLASGHRDRDAEARVALRRLERELLGKCANLHGRG
jgi:hypothetical protein